MATSEQQTRELTSENVRDMACPDCMSPGGTFTVQPVEEVVRVGNNCVIVTIDAAICGQCGYTAMDIPNTRKLEDAIHQLERGEVSGWQSVGIVYRA
jgi:hypothetical protein